MAWQPPPGDPERGSRRGRSRSRSAGHRLCQSLALVLAAAATPLVGQEHEAPAAASASADASALAAEHEDLSKQLQNPFADMILFPIQNITALDTGPDGDGVGNVANLQPVFPIALSTGWNLLARPILPIAYTSVPDSELGLGDLNLEPFLSPRKGGDVAWGFGVILGVPTATGDSLGTGKWTAGPSLALFALRGPWAFSVIANQQWSWAGDADRDRVSLFQLQPSLSYILGRGWFIVCGPLISADWTEPSGQQWTLPMGGGVGKVFSIGGQKVNLQLEGYANLVRPDEGPRSLILLTGTLLFPR